ncbi:hypothetical protein PAXRUDRAFT_16661 [Paxillus rubicundulus Ve08.2h10]|uniref:Uncharacterized protein n=1 Tax=Paxillus rubicundulus Ve08.2h10 TaxID=930991 RepID=A0A0D0DKS8_9AGAM|nr:hypothetical protein PAXRUDRAFT_16661 [Paxillus rubicundulus Ve08.2h10]
MEIKPPSSQDHFLPPSIPSQNNFLSYSAPRKSTPPLWNPLRAKSAFSVSPFLRLHSSALRSSAFRSSAFRSSAFRSSAFPPSP